MKDVSNCIREQGARLGETWCDWAVSIYTGACIPRRVHLIQSACATGRSPWRRRRRRQRHTGRAPDHHRRGDRKLSRPLMWLADDVCPALCPGRAAWASRNARVPPRRPPRRRLCFFRQATTSLQFLYLICNALLIFFAMRRYQHHTGRGVTGLSHKPAGLGVQCDDTLPSIMLSPQPF